MERTRKVTVLLPEGLIRDALEASGENLTATLREGLQRVAAGRAADRLRELRGKVRLSLDWRELRRDRA